MATGSPPGKTSDSAAASSEGTSKKLGDLLKALQSEDATIRLNAVQELGRLTIGNQQALRALERTAARDYSKKVREAALQALGSSTYRALQLRLSRLSVPMAQTILQEISQWEADGLIPSSAASLLRQRYYFAIPRAHEPTAKVAGGPRPTLSQVLLSETAIKIALSLGAFFVIAAAFILAAIIEATRLPILLLVTVGFLGAALSLKRRLPQASFILFTVFTFMLPIDAGVLLDLLELNSKLVKPYWMAVTLFLSILWSVATFFYCSRLFSILVLEAVSIFMVLLARWIDQSEHLALLLVEIPTVAALGGTFILQHWQEKRFSWPLFLMAQFQQCIILGLSTLIVLFTLITQESLAPGWWLVISSTWLLGALFYATSHGLTSFELFPILTAVSLLPVPLLFSGVFSPTFRAVMAITWTWGAILAMIGEGLYMIKRVGLRVYSPPLLGVSAVLFALAALGGVMDKVAIGVGYLVATAVVYLGLTIKHPRGLVWLGALLAATSAYFASFFLPSLKQYDFYLGFVMLCPALTLLTMNLIARWGFQAQGSWHLPPLILGSIIGSVDVLVSLVSGIKEPASAAIAFAISGVFLALFGVLDRRPEIGYGATTGLALSLIFVQIRLDQKGWLVPFVELASLYFFAGLVLTCLGQLGGWAKVLRISGLTLGVLVSLSAPFQGGPAAVIGTTLVATYFTLEAFRLRNVLLGFPANLLYLGAYFMVLVELEVSEPQFYSIGAALLGFIMHYLLVQSGSRQGAFFTGLVSQLVLLSTTYIQMLATERFMFFFVLFLQSLVVLVYGLVVRAKSFVVVPIIFSVIGVISVVFSVLAGIPATILVGCTGLLLLLLGILALLLREQLLKATEKLGERLGGWQG